MKARSFAAGLIVVLALVAPSFAGGSLDCTGDCGGDGAVTVDEVMTVAEVMLGNADLERCRAASRGGRAYVHIADLVTTVNNALEGCPYDECEPSGVYRCETDDDCVIATPGCCPCSMGGSQVAVSRDALDDLASAQAACCRDVICIALYNCRNDLTAVCREGRCETETNRTP